MLYPVNNVNNVTALFNHQYRYNLLTRLSNNDNNNEQACCVNIVFSCFNDRCCFINTEQHWRTLFSHDNRVVTALFNQQHCAIFSCVGGLPKFLRPGGSETPFPALSDKYFCQKGSVNWSSFHACFHAWYLPLVRNSWEVTKVVYLAQMQYSQKRLVMDFYLQFFFLVQTLTLPQIQVKYFVSLFIWRK